MTRQPLPGPRTQGGKNTGDEWAVGSARASGGMRERRGGQDSKRGREGGGRERSENDEREREPGRREEVALRR